MLLQRLVERARAGGETVPAFYSRRPVRYVLDIDHAGVTLAGLTDLADKNTPDRRFGVMHLVPAVTRTVGISPSLAVDNPEYVFGWVAEGAKPQRVAQQHAAFRDLIDRWAAADPHGPGPAVAAFYRAGHAQQVARPDGWRRNDLVAFRVDGRFCTELESTQAFWAGVADQRKGSGESGLCLACGRIRPLLKTIPQKVPARWVPGASNDASLVSVNESVHGFALQKFLGHTPICVDCGLQAMAALTALLSSNRHSTAYAGQDARIAWWLIGETDLDVMTLLDRPDEAQVRHLLASAARGRLSESPNLSRFCVVVLGGNGARIVVRDWIDLPLAKAHNRLVAWFDDLAMVDAWGAPAPPLGLTHLARVTGRWQAGRGAATGTWSKFGASGADRPDGIHRTLLGAALLGRRLPPSLLSHLVTRIRADGRVDTARVALIRLALRRHHTTTNPEVYMPALNTENRGPAYVCGRIFAVLEDLQRAVQTRRGGEGLNVTFTDRYFARAVTNPIVALVAGRRDARAWLKRLRRDRPGWAYAYETRLDDLFSRLDEIGMPGAGVLTQQAQFILGYHQQRAALRSERAQANAGRRTTDLPPQDDDTTPEPETNGEPE